MLDLVNSLYELAMNLLDVLDRFRVAHCQTIDLILL